MKTDTLSTTNVVFESPLKEQTAPVEGKCWRCGGTGKVCLAANPLMGAADGEQDVCGACFGETAPHPCPECRSPQMKIAYDGQYYMRCRNCGYAGPRVIRDTANELADIHAYHLWQSGYPARKD